MAMTNGEYYKNRPKEETKEAYRKWLKSLPMDLVLKLSSPFAATLMWANSEHIEVKNNKASRKSQENAKN